ncbi:hypothetical protein BRE01_46430 [Brevibacillus reuszeri]|uniref:Uncharacterized protein n=1 Tax=Brevibacillus reuszeri TaxID=54915 RepID=A0A0K9YZ13_9BACL|nr:hypothetical protein [Brevibacillus reuszeri]KNB73973.1 hypothetical protein ADS79_08610 [Brevibacillus reuszeri]MED1859866.1 hypothetical protein [Brevibacillus reuszeri]GED70941.1 hypothetical protein BRE01_46430 [Brevibacillus reuszeri]
MLKKLALPAIALILVVFAGIMTVNNPPSFLYGKLPFQSLSKQSVVSLIKDSPHPITKLTVEDGYTWYGAKADQGKEIESLLSAMKKNGWSFIQQEGAGYFFEQGSEKIVITSQTWSNRHVFFKVPVTNPPITLSSN